MRQARISDHWRHVHANPYHRSIRMFHYSNINGLGNGEINFRGGISVLCGGNGVGKSTLLDAIACTIISPGYASRHITHGRFLDALFEANLLIDEGEISRRLKFSKEGPIVEGEFEGEILHINPATLALNVNSFLNKTTNFSEVLESLEPKIATSTEIEQLSYIVGKEYDSFEIYEVEDYSLEGTDEKTPFPYFQVVSNGITYRSETMGLGELSLFILVWTLNRISEDSILLIEEPETYISPQSQKKFMDFLARISDIKRIWVILTTHSPSIVDQIPLDRITLLSRGAGDVTLIDTPTQFQLDEVLDKSHSYSGILLVEDAVAQMFLRSLLSRLASDVSQRYEILIAGDEGTLSKLIDCFPKESAWFEIAVVYDGDQRDKHKRGNIPHGFLPGTSSPEIMLRETSLKNIERLSVVINRSIEDLKIVLNSLQGIESHDWLDELGKRLDIQKEKLIDLLVGICLDTNEKAKNEAAELITLIRTEI